MATAAIRSGGGVSSLRVGEARGKILLVEVNSSCGKDLKILATTASYGGPIALTVTELTHAIYTPNSHSLYATALPSAMCARVRHGHGVCVCERIALVRPQVACWCG
eukprot:scaffold46236_cov26-Tisochrysis_lutea.AAC.5